MAPRHDRPAQAPGSNYVEPRSDDDFDEGTFLAVLGETAEALEQKGIPHLFMGGVSSAAYGRPRWTHDIDVFVRPDDARRALEILEGAGFETQETDPEWLFKALKERVLVDLIFLSDGQVSLDDAMVERARPVEVAGTTLPVIAPEDLIAIKALVFKERGPRHWYDALALLRRDDLDWDYLHDRAMQYDAGRVLSLLVYARSVDMAIPAAAIGRLFEETRR